MKPNFQIQIQSTLFRLDMIAQFFLYKKWTLESK